MPFIVIVTRGFYAFYCHCQHGCLCFLFILLLQQAKFVNSIVIVSAPKEF